jgi:hypothetical protein
MTFNEKFQLFVAVYLAAFKEDHDLGVLHDIARDALEFVHFEKAPDAATAAFEFVSWHLAIGDPTQKPAWMVQ